MHVSPRSSERYCRSRRGSWVLWSLCCCLWRCLCTLKKYLGVAKVCRWGCKGLMVVVVSQFNGTSTPKGSYSAKTGDNDCNVSSSRYSLSTALCESNSLSGQVWTKCPTRPDTQGRHVEAALMHLCKGLSEGLKGLMLIYNQCLICQLCI